MSNAFKAVLLLLGLAGLFAFGLSAQTDTNANERAHSPHTSQDPNGGNGGPL